MKKWRKYFQSHHRVASLVNLFIAIIFIWIVPYYLFANNSFAYIGGIVLTLIVVNIIGAYSYPWFMKENQ